MTHHEYTHIERRLNTSDVLYLVYILTESLEKITLTKTQPLVKYKHYTFSVINNKLFVNGEVLIHGMNEFEYQNLLVISYPQVKSINFRVLENKALIIGSDKQATIQTVDKMFLVIDHNYLYVQQLETILYCHTNHIACSQKLAVYSGMQLITSSFILEKFEDHWNLLILSDDVLINHQDLIMTIPKNYFPQDFPNYRRKPRLNLIVPDDKFQIYTLDKNIQHQKPGLLKSILPSAGMLLATGVTVILTGHHPAMMIGMGTMSLMTIGFSLSQYITERKAHQQAVLDNHQNYQRYLVSLISHIEQKYHEEYKILQYHHPSPEILGQLIQDYNSRIYERQMTNIDFLDVSIGLNDQATHLKIEVATNDKDFSESAKHVKDLKTYYDTQRDVPLVIKLKTQSLGIVAKLMDATYFMETLLLQLAFFHSYQDVNFIHLLSSEDYYRTWKQWRFLPHFQLKELNMRGLIYNSQLKEIVLNSFYQLLLKRKQQVNEAGKDIPIFSPHYVLTIFEDSYLAGHGINELLSENMNELGVTVIWVKENEHYLPETITAHIDISDLTKGRLVSNEQMFINHYFKPYSLPQFIENTVRQLANLNHLEVEKNAVPEQLSFLEQYEVNRVEELNIAQRWLNAEPNKSIRAVIGWRGRADKVYWDLHERVHGPHALVGGTTGSGKSEFLITYLLGLAINYSPEDVGFLIIDWKGGGIANTLADLPHFMGAITNLDGAGTERALASIKAELEKRQRQFAKYGVNNINGYMQLYKHRHDKHKDMNCPDEPMPHLILVSDEFAELKANVPEFLDELTSVARIGRSLGVHLILATQKPTGVVNDQIEANSTSKIALKMANIQDSNELLKTPDAAHITQAGRGYLRVGQNQVYELFQSGYAGMLYDPEFNQKEDIDERIFKINDLGQYELLYDPDDDLTHKQKGQSLPTQLEAIIHEINKVFHQSQLTQPKRPWLPQLSSKLTTPPVNLTMERQLLVPLGKIDLPSEQRQINHDYHLIKQSHTVIFGSPGYGKTTVLQTLIMNLARANTPEQVQFNLLDFGNNGLLPLVNLPHVMDIAALEDDEKLQKMLAHILNVLSQRKQMFKSVGVSNLIQYEQKTQRDLPINVVIVDNYDGMTTTDTRKEKLDQILLQVLREGASLGIYLILTANRTGSIRMNMMSTLATKMLLYLNDDYEVTTIMRKDSIVQQAINGRGQIMLDTPTAIQYYLPVSGQSTVDILIQLEKEVNRMNAEWKGPRPSSIPMVPKALSMQIFNQYIKKADQNTLYIGLNKQSAEVESFKLFQGQALGIFWATLKQCDMLIPRLLHQIKASSTKEFIMIDILANLKSYQSLASLYIDKNSIINQKEDLKQALSYLLMGNSVKRVIVINGFSELITKLGFTPEQVVEILTYSEATCQFIIIDQVSKIGHQYGGITTIVREYLPHIIFGGDLQQQHLIETLTADQKRQNYPYHIMHRLLDNTISTIVLPVEDGV